MKSIKTGATTLALAMVLAGGLQSATVSAEEAAGADDSVIEEVFVTARKRTESVLEIPESIEVISGEAIARQNLTTLDDIGNGIANLNLSRRADGFPNVSIRGVGSFGNTQGVGFYLDDVQIFSDASSRFGDLELQDRLGISGCLWSAEFQQ